MSERVPPDLPRLPARSAVGAAADWLDQWVIPYAREPQLWPVAVALVGHLVIGIAGLVLVAARTGSGAGWAAVALCGVASAALVAVEVSRRGVGRATAWLAVTWLGAAAVAWFGGRAGLL